MKGIQVVLIGSLGVLMTAALSIGQTAPTIGNASVTVDQQVHLGTNSSVFKEGQLFLWGGNGSITALGLKTLSSNTTGSHNTAVGTYALRLNQGGSVNTALGSNALGANLDGSYNTGVGAYALGANTSGSYNVAVGDTALRFNETGSENTAVGQTALSSNTSGSYNVAVGINALLYNQTGSENTAIGRAAMFNNTTGKWNTAVGGGALQSNIGDITATTPYYEGSYNVAVGNNALSGNMYGFNNTAVGYAALYANTSGRYNTAVGKSALQANDTGSENTAVGETALRDNTEGIMNVAVGINALLFNDTGSRNTAIGKGALFNLTTGAHNIALGEEAGFNLQDVASPTGASTYTNNIFIGNTGDAVDSNSIRIGTQGAHLNTYIAGVYGTSVTATHYVVVDANGQIGQGPAIVPSSRRYKEDVQSLSDSSRRLLELHPVTFRFKEEFQRGDPSLQFGLIAEEVAEVLPELVSFDEEGRPEAVKYRFLSSLLLNELQKQHRWNQEQATEIQRLTARLDRLEVTEPP